MLTLHTQRLEKTALHIESLRSKARIQAAAHVAHMSRVRRAALEEHLNKRGIPIPADHKRPPADATETEEHAVGNGVEEAMFKKRVVAQVRGCIPDGDMPVARLARNAVEGYVNEVPIAKGDDADMGVALIVGMARELQLTSQQVERMIDDVERDGGDHGLRAAVLRRMEMEMENKRAEGV